MLLYRSWIQTVHRLKGEAKVAVKDEEPLQLLRRQTEAGPEEEAEANEPSRYSPSIRNQFSSPNNHRIEFQLILSDDEESESEEQPPPIKNVDTENEKPVACGPELVIKHPECNQFTDLPTLEHNQ